MLLTWEEGRLARAEVQHLVAVHEAEIVPLILRHERLHYQLVEPPGFRRLEASGCPLVPRKGDPGQGGNEDDEVKGPILVQADPEYTAVVVGGQTLQLQPLSQLGVCDAAVTKPDTHLVLPALDPKAAEPQSKQKELCRRPGHLLLGWPSLGMVWRSRDDLSCLSWEAASLFGEDVMSSGP